MNATSLSRRRLLTAIPAAAASLSLSRLPGQERTSPRDIPPRSIDLLPFEDGLLYRENGLELPLPLIGTPQAPMDAAGSYASAAALSGNARPPRISAPPLIGAGQDAALSFNIYLPEDGDATLFETPVPGQPLAIRPSPFRQRAMNPTNAATPQAAGDSDGTVDKEYDYLLFRFDAYGIIRRDLSPTCVAGNVEGIWMKLDLPGPLLGIANRWKTFAEGSLGYITGSTSQYQFYWTKPKMCSRGTAAGTPFTKVFSTCYGIWCRRLPD